MKITLDDAACLNTGCCISYAPDHFAFDTAGNLIVSDKPIPDHARGLVTRAVRECPTAALALEGPSESRRR
jgi:ferredoxin